MSYITRWYVPGPRGIRVHCVPDFPRGASATLKRCVAMSLWLKARACIRGERREWVKVEPLLGWLPERAMRRYDRANHARKMMQAQLKGGDWGLIE